MTGARPGHLGTEWDRCTESPISIFADCSLTQIAQKRRKDMQRRSSQNSVSLGGQSWISPSFFFAFSACCWVIDPALTIRSIRSSFDISRSVCLALRIRWLDDGSTTL